MYWQLCLSEVLIINIPNKCDIFLLHTVYNCLPKHLLFQSECF